MFENLSYYLLQEYWWFIISLLGALFVFMTFVQGGQTLLYALGEREDERDLIINALGRKWELTFSTLVMFGGALFAAFPLFYAVSFGGAYYVWMAILFCFIIQAVSYEYRKKPNNVFGSKVYEGLLFINGSLGIFLLGVALATLYTGGNFVVSNMNLSHWTMASYGLEALLNPFNVAFGLMLVFLARVQGLLYFYNSLDNPSIEQRIVDHLKLNAALFLVLFLYVLGSILLQDGYGYDIQTKVVAVESLKFLGNLLANPLLLVVLLMGVLLVLFSFYLVFIKSNKKAIWFSGVGTVLTVTVLLFILGINHTVFYPSLVDMQSSLTIENSSSSHYTLITMSYVSLMVPFVLAYIAWAWRVMDRKQLTLDEVQNDAHHY